MQQSILTKVRHDISEKAKIELALLQGKPDQVIAQRIDDVRATIGEYLTSTKLIGGTVLDCVASDFLDLDFDVWAAAWNIEADSLELIKTLTSSKISPLLEPESLERFIKLLSKVSSFARGLQSDYCKAELESNLIDNYGGDNLARTLMLEQDYQYKLKKLSVEV